MFRNAIRIAPGDALFLEVRLRAALARRAGQHYNWLALLDALSRDLHQELARRLLPGRKRYLLVSSEVHYDEFDHVFGQVFRGVEADLRGLLAGVEAWLQDPKALAELDEATLAAQGPRPRDAAARLLDRLKRQKERYDGGNTWVGTGGASPVRPGRAGAGRHPRGRAGGGRSALAVADARRFQEFRKDVVLDTRQIAAALRRLRRLSREDGKLELDLDETIDATAPGLATSRSC